MGCDVASGGGWVIVGERLVVVVCFPPASRGLCGVGMAGIIAGHGFSLFVFADSSAVSIDNNEICLSGEMSTLRVDVIHIVASLAARCDRCRCTRGCSPKEKPRLAFPVDSGLHTSLVYFPNRKEGSVEFVHTCKLSAWRKL